ncbi:MAG: DUF4168 domain-containing protein [Candidatus Igneacidithiobacillus chanchocoensis]
MKKIPYIAAVTMLLVLGTGMALANTSAVVSGVPGKVNHQEMQNFAKSIKKIEPIDAKAHAVLTNDSLDSTAKYQKLAVYNKQIKDVLADNHLTPERYEMLLRKAETNKSFAQRTEKALHATG